MSDKYGDNNTKDAEELTKWHDVLIEEEEDCWGCDDDISSLFVGKKEKPLTGSLVWS